VFFLVGPFLFVAGVGDHSLELGRCIKSGNRPYADLVKSGYKLQIKHKALMILLYVWLYNENHMYESGNFFTFVLSHFWGLKTCKNTFFPPFLLFLFSHFTFW
jgi:hypothetical protein